MAWLKSAVNVVVAWRSVEVGLVALLLLLLLLPALSKVPLEAELEARVVLVVLDMAAGDEQIAPVAVARTVDVALAAAVS